MLVLAVCFCAELTHSGHQASGTITLPGWQSPPQGPRPRVPAGVGLIKKTLAIFLADVLHLLGKEFDAVFSVLQGSHIMKVIYFNAK